MSHMRRVVALILLAVLGWFVAFGAVGAISASASDDSAVSTKTADTKCC